MKFIDETIIIVQSGNGGRGCISFRREKFIPYGGPDGGNGGKGGDVILQATSQKRTLYYLKYKQLFKAKKGSQGLGNQKTGKNGSDVIIEIPVGTVITNLENNEILKDFVNHGETFVVAKGGRGGKGNKWFSTSTHQTPRFAQSGELGETLTLKIELKLLADIGIIGLPNAGKSSLLSVLSSAHPKIADYPFTTLTPNLGVVQISQDNTIIMADIPGLIEGAHEGAGLGIRFLKHIERTNVILHLIDASAIDRDNPLVSYEIINNELAQYSSDLSLKPQIIVLNKLDIDDAKENADIFKNALNLEDIFFISVQTGEGIEDLKAHIAKKLNNSDGES